MPSGTFTTKHRRTRRILSSLAVAALAGSLLALLSDKTSSVEIPDWLPPETRAAMEAAAKGSTTEQKKEEHEGPLTAAQCFVCHANPDVMKKDYDELFKINWLTSGPAELARPRPADFRKRCILDREAFFKSAHGHLQCTECHKTVTKIPHDQFLPVVKCEECHAEEYKLWSEGSHGKAFAAKDPDAPDCERCHGDHHEMLPSSSTLAIFYPPNEVKKCASCHGDSKVLGRHKDLRADAVPMYLETAHARGIFEAGLLVSASCSDCHGLHKVLPHDDALSSTSRKNSVATCGRCHTSVATTFTASIHGHELFAGNKDAPGCTSCHPGHEVVQVHTAGFQLGNVESCGECHEDEIKTYLLSYHGQAWRLGDLRTARCKDCHDYHDVRETTSPLSTVHPSHIVQTCRSCHPYANDKFAGFIPHLHLNDKSHPQTYYSWLFMTILLVGTMGFFVIHSILWWLRELAESRKRKSEKESGGESGEYVERFNLVHRLTHAFLFISVTGLAVTGLPLRYAETAWARWIFALLGGVKTAGVLHRIFAALTIVYVGIHFVYLWRLWRRAPKRPLLQVAFGPSSMVPNWTDVKQFFQHLRWFLFGGAEPKFGRWTYWEKFDYWAVFWGVAVIGTSGVIMAFPGVFARFLPGWAFNVALIIHSDEAVLAASFLFAIHFFHVHLRPRKFPMDHVMFTGKMKKEEMLAERPAEVEQLEAEGRLEQVRAAQPDPTHLAFNRVVAAVALAIGLVLLAFLFWSEVVARLI